MTDQDGELPVKTAPQEGGYRAGQGSRWLGCWWRTLTLWWLG